MISNEKQPPVDATVEAELLRRARQRLSDIATSGEVLSQGQGHAELITNVAADVVAAHSTDEIMDGRVMARVDQDRLAARLKARLRGMAGIDDLLSDDSVEDIWINGCDQVWTRHADGTKRQAAPVAASDSELVDMVRSMAATAGSTEQERRFDRASPILDLRLAGGVRLHAVQSVAERPCVSIRRHRLMNASLSDLVDLGSVDRDVASLLASAVRARWNIIIAGETGAGKTTLLRALAGCIDPDERLVTIEDNYELGLDADVRHPDTVALQVRDPNLEGEGGIDARALFRAGLRMNPSRVIVGEVRGAEAIPMLHAMSQGDNGSLSTIHAKSSSVVFSKLMLFGAAAPERLDASVMARLVAESVDLIVHLSVTPEKKRIVTSVREVVGVDRDQVASNELYRSTDSGGVVAHSPMSTMRARAAREYGYRPHGSDRS